MPDRVNTMDYSVFRSVIQGTRDRDMPLRIPAPSHRHGTPSGPWPFLDLDDHIDAEQLRHPRTHVPTRVCDHLDATTCNNCWTGYPQSLFPNWTLAQQKKSRISKIIRRSLDTSTIHYVDVAEDGAFTAEEGIQVTDANKEAHWAFMLAQRPTGTRLRAMFIEHLSGPVLQMLGTKYNVEPFFFSSSLGWIPSRYQEAIEPQKGDHITITLTFIRTMQNPTTVPPSPSSSYAASTSLSHSEHVIDTQAPLALRSSDRILLPDLLSLHMIRSSGTSTIISYHAGPEHKVTTAQDLHRRLNAAGRSVYWNHIFANNDDPSFVFLVLLWYALYAWDEALEVLYAHICFLEMRVIFTNDIYVTQELHVIQAHLLHYTSLLDDFRKTVVFVLETPNPALDNPARYTPEAKLRSQGLMRKECDNLLSEIGRLEKSKIMQGKRLQNVMNLGFSSVNIDDSRHMAKLTEAALRDSSALKQVSYMTMLFLPASLAATAFGMNVEEINPGTSATFTQYLAVAIPLTAISIWGIIALQFDPRDHTGRDTLNRIAGLSLTGTNEEPSAMRRILERIGWPVMVVHGILERQKALRRKLNPDP